jgi:hypothetical protein
MPKKYFCDKCEKETGHMEFETNTQLFVYIGLSGTKIERRTESGKYEYLCKQCCQNIENKINQAWPILEAIFKTFKE